MEQVEVAMDWLEGINRTQVMVAVGALIFTSYVVDIVQSPPYPESVPRVGHGKSIAGTIKDTFAYYTQWQNWFREGYEKYSKHERTFSVLSPQRHLILPRSQTTWLFEQSDSVLSANDAHNDFVYGSYNFLGQRLSQFPYQEHVAHKVLPRATNNLVPGLHEETVDAMDRLLGLDTEDWKSVNIWDMLLTCIPQISNRVLLGASLCRNRSVLKSLSRFTNFCLINRVIIGLFPSLLKPIVGYLVTIPNWIQYWIGARHTVPVIRQRLHDMSRKANQDPEYEKWQPPEDFITWIIRTAANEGIQIELQPHVIAKRVLPVNFAAIHTTATTCHSALINLLTADPSLGYVESLREEVTRVWEQETRENNSKNSWTKQGLASLYRLDSALRESQRFSNFAVTTIGRKIVAPSGITNPFEGWHAEPGLFLSLNMHGLYFDPDLHRNPNAFDPFRYSRPREEFEARPEEKKDRAKGVRLKSLSMVSTGDANLAFGHGRHACPGRFLASFVLKMIISHILLNYEIKHIPEKPPTRWLAQNIIPPTGVCMQVRRRKGTV